MSIVTIMTVISLILNGFMLWRILRIEKFAAKFDEDLTLRAENVILEEGDYDGN